jgi:DNA replication initiation complex subunit (GINS family)
MQIAGAEPMTAEEKEKHEKLVARIEQQQTELLKAQQAAKAMQQREKEEEQRKQEVEKAVEEKKTRPSHAVAKTRVEN